MSKLLQVDADAAEKALGTRIVSANQELMEIGHNLEQACYGRDAFAKVSEGPTGGPTEGP